MSSDHVAIVTGAGSGIGRCVCELLARGGSRLTLVGRTETTLLETQSLLSGEAGIAEAQSLIVPADLAEAEHARRVIDLTMQTFGRIDALVNNAALCGHRLLVDLREDELLGTFAANTFGPARLIAGVLPHMIRQGSGCIVNVSSMAAVDPFPGLGVYGATKAALDSFTRSIMNETRGRRIRAFSIAPGAVETAMLRGFVSEKALPADKTLDPRCVAEVIVQCVTGERDAEAGKAILLPSP